MFAVIGLGNPGKDYEETRHNIGFKTIDLLSERNNIETNKIKFQSVYGEGFIGRNKVILLKPQTYMNNSGVAVRELCDFYKLEPENIIVIVDDIDIEFGKIRLRQKGSAGSHNGLRSIISQLGTQKFPRLKIGIGSKRPNEDLSKFVLSRFSRDERDTIEEAIVDAALSVEIAVSDGIIEAMNKFN